jgi:hypothetical protein
VINGWNNQACGCASTVINGSGNVAHAHYSFIGNGGVIGCTTFGNHAIQAYSFIGNGTRNTASGIYSTVLNGQINLASVDCASVLGGCCNQAIGGVSGGGGYPTVVNGNNNTASCYWAFIGNGGGFALQ